MKRVKQRLTQLNNVVNNKARKSNSEALLLFIAEAVAENSNKLTWLIATLTLGIAILLALLIRGG